MNLVFISHLAKHLPHFLFFKDTAVVPAKISSQDFHAIKKVFLWLFILTHLLLKQQGNPSTDEHRPQGGKSSQLHKITNVIYSDHISGPIYHLLTRPGPSDVFPMLCIRTSHATSLPEFQVPLPSGWFCQEAPLATLNLNWGRKGWQDYFSEKKWTIVFSDHLKNYFLYLQEIKAKHLAFLEAPDPRDNPVNWVLKVRLRYFCIYLTTALELRTRRNFGD